MEILKVFTDHIICTTNFYWLSKIGQSASSPGATILSLMATMRELEGMKAGVLKMQELGILTPELIEQLKED